MVWIITGAVGKSDTETLNSGSEIILYRELLYSAHTTAEFRGKSVVCVCMGRDRNWEIITEKIGDQKQVQVRSMGKRDREKRGEVER